MSVSLVTGRRFGVSGIRRAGVLAASASIALLGTLTPIVSAAPPSAAPPAVPGSGPISVTGTLTYSNALFTAGVDEPEIILEDQTGFITHNRHFVMPVESQTIGQLTSDFQSSPVSYSLSLPKQPHGTLHDVNHDGHSDKGVMVFAVAFWANVWGDAYLERRDLYGGGWSTAYASTRTSQDFDSLGEVFGGKYVVFAPNSTEEFPSGFGADQKLFTNDDPMMSIPQGWSVINMDVHPFAVVRSAHPVVDLIEPPAAALTDFSSMSYTDAFDGMLDMFRHRYAWTNLKHIDWDAISAEFRPRFVAAQQNHDEAAYQLALRDFTWAIPDSHVSVNSDMPYADADFNVETAGGLGFAMTKIDAGKFLVSFVTAGASADKAGMVLGTQIIQLDGQPVADVVAADVPFSSPFSNPIAKQIQQQRYALRFPLSKGHVMVTFKNPGGSVQSVSLKVVSERDSFAASSINEGVDPDALPVEFKILDNGLGYIQINSFFDSARLTISLYERALQQVIGYGLPGVILDLRHNGGGNGWLADQMAAYFFHNEIPVEQTARYDPSVDKFVIDTGSLTPMIPPPAALQYSGPVAVLVGPGCYSACEFFSHDMTVHHRAAIVGQYPTEGAGGNIEVFLMPGDLYVQFTIGRGLTPGGKVLLEGKGVSPTVKVPINLDTILRHANGEDVVLTAAEHLLAP